MERGHEEHPANADDLEILSPPDLPTRFDGDVREDGSVDGSHKPKRPHPIRRVATMAGVGKGWTALRHLLTTKPIASTRENDIAFSGHQLTTELLLGTLGNVILRLGMDVDEHGHKRIPVLMNFLSECSANVVLNRADRPFANEAASCSFRGEDH